MQEDTYRYTREFAKLTEALEFVAQSQATGQLIVDTRLGLARIRVREGQIVSAVHEAAATRPTAPLVSETAQRAELVRTMTVLLEDAACAQTLFFAVEVSKKQVTIDPAELLRRSNRDLVSGRTGVDFARTSGIRLRPGWEEEEPSSVATLHKR